MKVCGIYKIESKIKPERIYVGSATNITKRWDRHIEQLRKNEHHSKKLQYHYDKYGREDLLFSIILECDKKDLLTNEQQYLDDLRPFFNIRIIANSNIGLQYSKEHKEKISNAHKGNKYGLGHIVSKEHRNILSKLKKGVKLSEEHCKKLSEAHKGKPSNRKGTHHTEESKQKCRESHLGQIAWNKGKTTPDHVREKQREARLKYLARKQEDINK